MQTIRNIAFIVLASLLFQACKKGSNDPIPNGGTRLRMVSELETENYFTRFRSFNYSASGQMESYIDSVWFRTDTKEYTGMAMVPQIIKYDQQGRIQEIRDGNFNDRYELWYYNTEGLVEKREYVDEIDPDTIALVLTYDSQKRVIADSSFDYKKKNLIVYSDFRYDANNNLVGWSHYTNESGTLQNPLNAEITYDDHPNPYHKIGFMLVPDWNDLSGLSSNNPLEVRYSNGTIERYQYQYYSNGLPRSAVKTLVSGQTLVRSINYQYD